MSRRLEVYALKSVKLQQYCKTFAANTSMGLPCIIRETLYWISSYINDECEYGLYIENTIDNKNPVFDKIIGLFTVKINNYLDTKNIYVRFELFDFENCLASEILTVVRLYIKSKTSFGKKIISIKINSDNYYAKILELKYKTKTEEDDLVIIDILSHTN